MQLTQEQLTSHTLPWLKSNQNAILRALMNHKFKPIIDI